MYKVLRSNQYKKRFTKWGWTKYNKTRQSATETPAPTAEAPDASASGSDDWETQSLDPRLQHAGSGIYIYGEHAYMEASQSTFLCPNSGDQLLDAWGLLLPPVAPGS